MIFSSITFIIFFVVVLILLSLTKLQLLFRKFNENKIIRIRHFILLIASYVFYGWWDWRFCLLTFLLTIVSYQTAQLINKNRDNKRYVVIGVVFPLIILGFFKYFNFFLESFSAAFGITNLGTLNIILPVGISFYTFQSMTYTIDVYRNKMPVSNDFLKLATYISFFPQLLAGPIAKARDFLPQFEEKRNVSLSNLEAGVQMFLIGLFKKIVIADNLGVFVDDVFAAPGVYHSLTIILAVITYSIQIYFDFSGYSDMAIGCARCMGYDLPRNFNLPYIARNVSEFWKRWHISLSSWLAEYIYFSLGGRRKGTFRTYLNIMITMLLGGLWHGASWNFVIWGFLHGVALCVHKAYLKFINKGEDPSTDSSTILVAVSIFATFMYSCICRIFFRATDMETAKVIFYQMFVWHDGVMQIYSWSYIAIFLLVIYTFIAYKKSNKGKDEVNIKSRIDNTDEFYPMLNLSKFWHLVIFLFVIGLTLGLAYVKSSNPFIYFQF